MLLTKLFCNWVHEMQVRILSSSQIFIGGSSSWLGIAKQRFESSTSYKHNSPNKKILTNKQSFMFSQLLLLHYSKYLYRQKKIRFLRFPEQAKSNAFYLSETLTIRKLTGEVRHHSTPTSVLNAALVQWQNIDSQKPTISNNIVTYNNIGILIHQIKGRRFESYMLHKSNKSIIKKLILTKLLNIKLLI